MVNTEKKVGIKYESQKKSQKKIAGFRLQHTTQLARWFEEEAKEKKGGGGQKRGSLTLFSFFPSSSSFFLHPVF